MASLSEPEKLPPKSYRERIEKLAEQISDPVRKLKFLNQAVADYYRNHAPAPIESEEEGRSKEGERKGKINAADRSGRNDFTDKQEGGSSKKSAGTGRWYGLVLFWGLTLLVCGLGIFMIFSRGKMPLNIADYFQLQSETVVYHHVDSPALDSTDPNPSTRDEPEKQIEESPSPPEYPEYPDTLVWMIEKTSDSEYYSNRLRIFTTETTDNIPRHYHRIPIGATDIPKTAPESDQVAGLLFHASESDIYAFKPEMTQSIKEYSRLLIRYIRNKKAYHYFIDRFGQVYRLVREDHAAFHAGNSIWMDSESVYLDLNHAFIGICFEGKDFKNNGHRKRKEAGNGNSTHITPMDKSSISEAQLRSGKELTDWLRVKYKIPQHNCVPHSLVSVNPYDGLIGHHLDLSYDFPFDMFGLSNKYQERIPAITEFGFSSNNYFSEIMKGRIWPGIALSEEYLKNRANERKMPLKDYRRLLNSNFKKLFEWQKEMNHPKIEL